MPGERDSEASGKGSDSNTLNVLPQFPGEDFQAHEASHYKEQVDARLTDMGLIAVAQGHPPASVKAIKDFDLSIIPVYPPSHKDYFRTLESRMKMELVNSQNAEKRRELEFSAWTKIYTLFKVSTEVTAPVLSRELLQKCDIQVLHGLPGGYFDGPRAYRICMKRLKESSQSQADKDFYRTAERLQRSTRLPDGAPATEFNRKALAFLVKINPFLAQPYGLDDASDYLITLMPAVLREGGRRIKNELIASGDFQNHMQVIKKCRELVHEEQKTQPATPSFVGISLDDLGMHDLDSLRRATGMDLADPYAAGFAGGGGGSGAGAKIADAGAVAADNWGPCCPHKEGVICFLSPDYVGPPPVNVFLNKERWTGIKSARLANARKSGKTAKALREPTKEAIDAFYKKKKERKEAAKAKKGDKTEGGVAVEDDGDWRQGLLDITAMAVDEDELADLLETHDEDGEEGAPPQYWYVLMPLVDGTMPKLLCEAHASYLAYDTSLYSHVEFGADEAAARSHISSLVAAISPGTPAVVKPAQDAMASQAAPTLVSLSATPSDAALTRAELGDVPTPLVNIGGGGASHAPQLSTALPQAITPARTLATSGGTRSAMGAQGSMGDDDAPTPLRVGCKPSAFQAPFGGCGVDCPGGICGDVAPEPDEPEPASSPPYREYVAPPDGAPQYVAPPDGAPPVVPAGPRGARTPDVSAASDKVRSARNHAAGVALAAGLLVAAMLYFGAGAHKNVALGSGFFVTGFHVHALDNGLYERVTFEEFRRVLRCIYERVTADDVRHAVGRVVTFLARWASAVGGLIMAHFAFFMWVAGAYCFLALVAGATRGGMGSTLVAPSVEMNGKWMSPPLIAPSFSTELVASSDAMMERMENGWAPLMLTAPPPSSPPSPPPSPPTPSPTNGTLSADKPPRADYLTHAQAQQLHCELLAGNEVPKSFPTSVTKTIAIADTGCARSMANHEDHFRDGSIFDCASNVSGAAGAFQTKKQGHLNWPMDTDAHGIRCWDEMKSIVNKSCAYVLLALGRASHEKGLELTMPGWGQDARIHFPNGVSVTLHNRHVLVLRPIGYKPSPSKQLAMAMVSASGDFVLYLSSGPPRDGDLTSQCKSLGLDATIVLIDPVIGGKAHDLTDPAVASALLAATAPSKERRCLGVLSSIRCKTWSAANFLPDAKGRPGKLWRDCDNLLGIKRNGTLPQEVVDSNLESTHAVRITTAVVKQGGFGLAEAPARRVGPKAIPRHVLPDCSRAVHMFDHPAWAVFASVHNATEHVWDQCKKADEPKSSPIKSTIWLATPNISNHVKAEFGEPPLSLCDHPAGTHEALRGADPSGRYKTAASKSENYSAGTNLSVAKVIVAYRRGLGGGTSVGAVAGVGGGTSVGAVAGVVQGKTLAKHSLTHQLLHDSFNHVEARVLRLLPRALSDATDAWAEVIEDRPCKACLEGNAPKLGPTGTLPTDEGLLFLDIHHVTVREIFTGFNTTVGSVHAATGFCKSVRVGSKAQAHEVIELICCYFNSMQRPVTWIHCDNAHELKGTKVVLLARGKNIRITTTTMASSRKNRQEPQWPAVMSVVRKNVNGTSQSFWGWAFDHAEEGRNLLPSREPPHDCALGRLMSTAGQVVKPPGSFRRPFMCLCYPVLAPRLPSGTLVNKTAPQSKAALLVGYVGGRSGSWETLGTAHTQAGYLVFMPDEMRTIVTSDVRIIPSCKPALVRTSRGGWAIDEKSLPFFRDEMTTSEADGEPVFDKDGARVGKSIKDGEPATEPAADSAAEPPKQGDATPLVEIENDGDLMQNPQSESSLELRLGFAPEPETPSKDHAAGRGGGSEDALGRGGDGSTGDSREQTSTSPPSQPPARYLVPRAHWPDEACDEHDGLGWEIVITKRDRDWALCKFVNAKTAEGTPYADEWRRYKDLMPLEPRVDVSQTPVAVEPRWQVAPHVGKGDEPVTEMQQAKQHPEPPPTPVPFGSPGQIVPNKFTLPAPGESDPLREPTRPVRETRQPERLAYSATAVAGERLTTLPPRACDVAAAAACASETVAFAARPEGDRLSTGYSIAALAAAYAEAAGVGFDVHSARLPEAALCVETERGADRIVALACDLAESRGEKLLADSERELRSQFDDAPLELQRAAMISLDHALVREEYGHTSPQAILIRESYAAAMVDAACHGVLVPPLEPLCEVGSGNRKGEVITMAAAFDEDLSGAFVLKYDTTPGDEIFALSKAASQPDIFNERGMRGAEWDEPKQLEVAKIERLGAKTDVCADDPTIKGMQVNEFTWVGKCKRNADGSVLKLNARAAARGDLDKGRLDLTSNDTSAPVARTSSMMDFDAVACLRAQHQCDYDVPGAFLQGEQTVSERRLYRPPRGFRKWDERGIEILWLSNHPFYGQTDASAIWNRTINETMTSKDPPYGCGLERCAYDPCVYGTNVAKGELGGQVSNTLYVDDGRLGWDDGKAAAAKAREIKTKLHARYGIKFGEDDPSDTHFLGANIHTSKDRRVRSIRATSYIDLQVKRYADGDVSAPKFPAHWSSLPADETLVREWEAAMATRTPASPELTKRYGSLFGSLLHATKFRPEISAAMGLLGSCLTFPTEQLYECAMHVLVYLGRSRNLGVTFSAHLPGAKELRAYCDANWTTTRSTTGFCLMLAGGAISCVSRRQHCITMSTCEAELVALCDTAIELLHAKAVNEFLGHETPDAIEVCTDSKAAFDLCHRFTSAANSRHVDRKLFKMRELRGAGVVRVRHIPGETNPADIFTKILTRQPFEKHRKFILNLPGNSGVDATRAGDAWRVSSLRDGTGTR